MRAARRLFRHDHVPSPGSSLLNPRSQRAKIRRMMATHTAQEKNFEQQAVFAGIGSGQSGKNNNPSSPARSRKERSARASLHAGKEVAERAKHMTDSEWESVSMDDKHAFTKYVSRMLREHPTETTEQQRRRYFETTMADVRDLDPQKTVRDEYERIKLGLPVHLKNPQHSLGVSQAVYDAADASLFDADNVHKLENAMTHIKQVFADYVRKKREGVSTEAERRQLANMTADLNVETQKHLANTFKYAEMRLRQVTLDERHRQMAEIERLKKIAMKKSGGSQQEQKKHKKTARMERLKRVISKAVGLDMDVAETVLTEMQAQEEFLQFCEVFARLTQGKGFYHTSKDETLDAYVENLRKLYSMNAGTFSTLDVVQYYASKEGSHPVDWAKRWYEKALLIPLQNTPEYKKLLQIQEQERLALKVKEQSSERNDTIADLAESEVASVKMQRVVNIVEKMFMDPRDKRLESLHEKRLRYLAHMQMERQIKRVRENAKLFEGVEDTPEAEECRELYKGIMQRKTALSGSQFNADSVSVSTVEPTKLETNSTLDESEQRVFNVYDDAEAAALFDKIRAITHRVIQERCVASAAAAKARRLHRIIRSLKGGGGSNEGSNMPGAGPGSLADELRALQRARRARVTQRLLGLVEGDVRAEAAWLEAMAEAERPPLLPVPTGMSYVSAADVRAWRERRLAEEQAAGNPFERRRTQGRGNTKAVHSNDNTAGLTASEGADGRRFRPELLGQAWRVPDRPLLFWGTGVTAVQQALRHAAEDAERKRTGTPLAPPYPCPENPWGWRLAKDVLDED
ncbi:trichohyalin [Trypanosoma theileri]|uniref:Trichohyalin n=1 Tax=Trypanosoma theileri TaxID=67003 RepID=A0A1X0NS88_9TRYP|nr:trichohyalin [Trypanosoma theileri]ORC87343.1 trichohyalin [Trypanosoma theileri]